MATAIGDLVVRLGMDTKNFQSGVSRASKEVASLQARVGAKITGVAGVVAAAAGAAITAIGVMAVRTAKAMDDIADAAGNIGVTTEALVALRHQAELSNTSAEVLESGLTKMMRGVGSGTSGGALAALGLDAGALRGMSAEQQFAAIAEAMSKIQNRSQQIALATQIFGKTGAELVTMLNGGAEATAKYAADAKELGISFDAIDAARVGAVTDEWYRAGQALQGFKQTLTVQLAPTLGAAAELVTKLFVEMRKGLGSSTREWYPLRDAIGAVGASVQQLVILYLELQAIQERIAIGMARAAGDEQSVINLLQKEYGETLAKIRELQADDWGEDIRNKWTEIANATGTAADAVGDYADTADEVAKRFKPATDAFKLFNDWAKQAGQFNMTDRMKQINDAVRAGAPKGLVDALKLADAELTKLEKHADQMKFAESLNEKFKDPFDAFLEQAAAIDAASAMLAPGVREKALQSAYDEFAGAPKGFEAPRYSGAMERGSSEAYSTLLNAGKQSDRTAKEHLNVGRMTLEELRQINKKTTSSEAVSIPS